MSKRVSQLLLALALASANFAVTASGTYLTVVPGNSELRSLVSAKTLGEPAEDAKTSEVAVRLVYSRTWDSANLGKYFTGIADTNNAATLNSAPAAADIDQTRIIRYSDNSAVGDNAASTVTFLPRSTRMALNFSFCQDLQSVMEGSWFDLNVSLARVKNDLNAVIAAGAKTSNTAGDLAQFLGGTAGMATAAAQGLLAGKIATAAASTDVAANGPEQAALRLGYNFVRNDNGTFGAFVSGVVGLGTRPTLANLFESVVGHRNMGLGLGVQGTVSLSKTDDYEMQLNINAAGHYMFARQDYRLGQFVSQTGATNVNWMHYYMGKDLTSGASTPFAPTANFLKQMVNVAPRYNADLGAQFVYVGDCVDFDLGYAMHYQAAEQNTLVTAWNDATYVIVGSASTNLTPGTANALGVKAANLSWSEDSQLLHTLHGGVVYNCKDMENPVQLGLGGSISLANDRARSEEHWSAFAKLGVAF